MDRDTLIAYVLGALGPEDERRVVEHLRGDPDDAGFVRDTFEALTGFVLSQPPDELPVDGELALLDSVRARGVVTDAREDQGSAADGAGRRRAEAPRRRLWPALAAAAVIAVLVLVPRLAGQDATRSVDAMLRETCAQTDVVCEPLMSGEGSAMGMVAKRPDARLLLVMAAEPPPGGAFQAWQIMEGEPTSLGVFDGRAMGVDGPLMPGASLAITIEPTGGSARPTTEPVALMQL